MPPQTYTTGNYSWSSSSSSTSSTYSNIYIPHRTQEELRRKPQPWEGNRCAECGVEFANEDEWDSRHSDDDGEDIHEVCCETWGPCSREDSDHA